VDAVFKVDVDAVTPLALAARVTRLAKLGGNGLLSMTTTAAAVAAAAAAGVTVDTDSSVAATLLRGRSVAVLFARTAVVAAWRLELTRIVR
jgi:hypothetical protein